MSKSDLLSAFNNQLTELIEELINVIPNNPELKTAHAQKRPRTTTTEGQAFLKELKILFFESTILYSNAGGF